MPKVRTHSFTKLCIVETIGTIWKNSQKIVKDNKRFKRVHERKLNKLSTEINHLNTLVNQSLSVVKKERERFRLEKQEHILRMFQNKTDSASTGKES